MKTLKQVQRELKSNGANNYMANSLEAKALPKILKDGENIKAFIYGPYDHRFGMMVATNKRLIFVDCSWLGQRTDDIPYGMIASVEYDQGPLWGSVKVYARSKSYSFKFVRKNLVAHFAKEIEKFLIEYQPVAKD